MAEGNTSQSPLLGGGIIVIITVIAGLLVGDQIPISSLRPDGSGIEMPAYGDETVPARLWQDPFTAVYESVKDGGQLAIEVSPLKDASNRIIQARRIGAEESADRLAGFLAQGITRKDAGILMVMVPAGSSGADVERRLRIRYAVLTALSKENYAPDDARHIGYIRLKSDNNPQERLPAVLPYEWHSRRDVGRGSLVILWLDEGGFTNMPLHKLARLKRHLGAERRWFLLGPSGSTVLQAMVREMASGVKSTDWNVLKGLRIYSPFATVPDDFLQAGLKKPEELRGVGEGDGEPWYRTLLKKHGIRFVRTIADDAKMAALLVEELRLRGIDPECGAEAGLDCPQHIVLLSEFDTRYGRLLPSAFIHAATGKGSAPAADSAPPANIHLYHYLRGIDGQLPDKRNGGKDEEGSGRKDTSDTIERPSGRGQADYLRRLAIDLKRLDRDIRNHNLLSMAAGIQAIGVLGSDVYDKMMVLQAMRPFFPDAVFFTTDLDAILIHPSQWDWARNLVVASSYGLRLGEDLQAGAPPFRSVYQSAAFLSTRLLLRPEILKHDKSGAASKDLQKTLDDILTGRTFEVGRDAAIPLSRKDRQLPASLYPEPVGPTKGKIAAISATIGLILLFIAVWCRIYGIRILSVSVGAVVTLILAMLISLSFLPMVDTLEPVSWTLGVSIWPTEFIRFFILFLMLYYFCRIRADLRENSQRIDAMLAGSGRTAVAEFWREYVRKAERYRSRVWGPVIIYLAAGSLLLFLSGIPQIPYRGLYSRWIDLALFAVVVFSFAILVARVLDATWYCRALLGKIEDHYLSRVGQAPAGLTKCLASDMRVVFRLIAERTEVIGNMIHYPMIVILLMTAACTRFFDNWYFPLSLILIISGTFFFIAGCSIVLRRTAERFRRDFMGALFRLRASSSAPLPEVWERLLEEVRILRYGAFRPLSQQPWVHAVALFLGGGGGMIYLQFLSMFD